MNKNEYLNKENMNITELIRNKAFFFIDWIKGGKIRGNLNELEQFYLSPNKEVIQEEQLANFLKYAKENTNFYSNYRDKNFTSIPIITKEYIARHSEQFLSLQYNNKQLNKVTTSGSYGTPMSFYRNKEKQLRQIADVIYFGKPVEYFVGRNHAFIRGVAKGRLNLFLQNEKHIDPTKLDDISLQKMVDKVQTTKFIIGFPSVIISFIQYCIKKGYTSRNFNILGIICTAEPLTEHHRDIIKSFFKCPVVARYAMEELGLIANQCLNSNNYHVNDATFIVEILKKESDEPADLGEEGRIVITDLYSQAMPLIRYDTGDYGILEKSCSCGYNGKVLKTISGRKIQSILDSNGSKISPFSINVLMKDYENIYQFQFIQEDFNDYQLYLIVNEKFNKKEEIREELLKILGSDANINISFVDEIKPLPSGKRPYIINKLNKYK